MFLKGGINLTSDVNAFIGLGIALIIVGITWMVFNDTLTDIKSEYWISTPYLELMNMGFNVYPTVILILGIFSLLGGIKIHTRVVG